MLVGHVSRGNFELPGEVLEGVPGHGVATCPEGQTHSVLAALDEVVGESDIEALQGGQARVLPGPKGKYQFFSFFASTGWL